MRSVRRGERAHSPRCPLLPVTSRSAAVLAVLLSATACAKRYRIEGLVTSVDPDRRTMTVSHRAIPGYMPAMMMPFRVRHPDDLGRIRPGVRVRLDLTNSLARNIRILDTKPDFTPPSPVAQLVIGDPAPDFELTDEQGRSTRLSQFRGRVVAIDFIYTRCPLPDVCPRLSAGFAYVARQLRSQDLTLLSVTVDPRFDTPEVLRGYSQRWNADPRIWHFLTGSLEAVRDVAGRFGLLFWPEENMISHTVATVVIDRQGRVAARIEGSSYRTSELRDLIASILATTR
jgi:protein SCO1/2